MDDDLEDRERNEDDADDEPREAARSVATAHQERRAIENLIGRPNAGGGASGGPFISSSAREGVTEGTTWRAGLGIDPRLYAWGPSSSPPNAAPGSRR
jgi:hypothetical protein